MIAKKGSALTSVSYAEALEAALCHGWIDGQKQAHDSEAWSDSSGYAPLRPRFPD
jgi:uncharacterized protein YdeI (YjbR/CyaY-like superfamily)